MKVEVTATPTGRDVGVQICLLHFSPSLKEQCSWAHKAIITIEGTCSFGLGEPSPWWTNGGGVARRMTPPMVRAMGAARLSAGVPVAPVGRNA
jgi:hypothetical protein